MATSEKIRMCLLIPRKKGMSEKEFHSHWANIHGPLVADLLVAFIEGGDSVADWEYRLIKYGVSSYKQV